MRSTALAAKADSQSQSYQPTTSIDKRLILLSNSTSDRRGEGCIRCVRAATAGSPSLTVLCEQYHIPVLHLHSTAASEAAEDYASLAGRKQGVLKGGRVMRHKVDQEELIRRIQGWTEKLNASN